MCCTTVITSFWTTRINRTPTIRWQRLYSDYAPNLLRAVATIIELTLCMLTLHWNAMPSVCAEKSWKNKRQQDEKTNNALLIVGIYQNQQNKSREHYLTTSKKDQHRK